MKNSWCKMVKMSLSSISAVLKYNKIVKEAFSFEQMLFRLFGKDSLEAFAGLASEVLGEDRFRKEHTEARLTFLSPGYVFGVIFRSLEELDEEGCSKEC